MAKKIKQFQGDTTRTDIMPVPVIPPTNPSPTNAPQNLVVDPGFKPKTSIAPNQTTKNLPLSTDFLSRAEYESKARDVKELFRASEEGSAVARQQIIESSPAFQQQQALAQQATQQIGQVTPPTNIQEAPIDVGQALTAGTVRAIPSIIRAAGAGAGAGALGGAAIGGVGAIPGAVVGAAAGVIAQVWSGVQSNIAQQQKGQISASQDVLSSAKTNMRSLATLAAKDPTHADIYVAAYNQQLSQVHAAHEQIKAETQGNLNKFTEDGTDILSDFELFLQPGGQADVYGRKLGLALIGAPIEFTAEELALEMNP